MNFRYIGEAGRVWPSVPVTPQPNDVVDFGPLDVEAPETWPDPRSWEATDEAATRAPDNAPRDDVEGAPFMQPKVDEKAAKAEARKQRAAVKRAAKRAAAKEAALQGQTAPTPDPADEPKADEAADAANGSDQS